ncbi:metallophosphoesterase family protein [Halospina denitrificans]|nr:metallophosphoesterase [Halospina denitrificans]
MQILAVGDLHLGAAPSRLPDELTGRASDLGATGVWHRIVEQAITSEVDAVVLAGDVVEDEDDFFEAYRELSRGVERLTGAGIRVLGIVGNHDVRVLPRLADQIQGFELLGRGGQWQTAELAAGSERLTLHGWSFPQRQVTASPLQGHEFTPGPGPNLGLLHADRDQPASVYAPVSSAELDAAPLDGWMLGHIHKPDALSASHLNGYLGSATGLDPGESGPRGPWLLRVEGGAIRSLEQWLIAPLQWERLTVDLTALASTEEARERLIGAVNERDAAFTQRGLPPEAVALRITLAGRTALAGDVRRLLERENLDTIHAGQGNIHYFVEHLAYATEPELSIEVLAQRSDPAGLMAHRLQVLARPSEDPERRSLINRAREQMKPRIDRSWWQPLGTDGPDDAMIADWLHQAGTRALEQMLAQGAEEQ